jgi:hypothetical protein
MKEHVQGFLALSICASPSTKSQAKYAHHKEAESKSIKTTKPPDQWDRINRGMPMKKQHLAKKVSLTM